MGKSNWIQIFPRNLKFVWKTFCLYLAQVKDLYFNEYINRKTGFRRPVKQSFVFFRMDVIFNKFYCLVGVKLCIKFKFSFFCMILHKERKTWTHNIDDTLHFQTKKGFFKRHYSATFILFFWLLKLYFGNLFLILVNRNKLFWIL